MINPKAFCFLVLFLFLPGFISPIACHAAAEESSGKNATPKPIVIESKTLEVDNQKRIVTFTGNVNAKKDDFVVDCQKMLVYYRPAPDKGSKDEFSQGIDRIVATGQVRVTRKEGGVATADKAVYFQEDDKIVLTGHPSVQQGKDLVKGDRITIFLKENRSTVESTGKERAQAIIFPKKRKTETP
jgi:lipopolysaccharide export system protein LptA